MNLITVLHDNRDIKLFPNNVLFNEPLKGYVSNVVNFFSYFTCEMGTKAGY